MTAITRETQFKRLSRHPFAHEKQFLRQDNKNDCRRVTDDQSIKIPQPRAHRPRVKFNRNGTDRPLPERDLVPGTKRFNQSGWSRSDRTAPGWRKPLDKLIKDEIIRKRQKIKTIRWYQVSFLKKLVKVKSMRRIFIQNDIINQRNKEVILRNIEE